jgi:hypothetical protein
MLLRVLLAAILAAVVVAPGVALAAGSPVIADCVRHLRLERRYSVTQLEQALRAMPADVSQYTDCADVIRSQLLAQIGARRSSARTRPGAPGGPGESGFPVWAIAVLVAVALGGAGTALAAVRRGRRSPAPP